MRSSSDALAPRTSLRYDYKAYSAPEGDPTKHNGGTEASETSDAIRKSWHRRAPWTGREKSRLTSTQVPDGTTPAKGRKRAAAVGRAKGAAKRRAAPNT